MNAPEHMWKYSFVYYQVRERISPLQVHEKGSKLSGQSLEKLHKKCYNDYLVKSTGKYVGNTRIVCEI